MSGQTAGEKVTVRKLARERMASLAAAHRKSEEENTADLTAFLKASNAVERAAMRRDAALAAANETYAAAAATAEQDQAGALARIKARGGASDDEIAALTGLTVAEVRRLLRLKPAAAAKG